MKTRHSIVCCMCCCCRSGHNGVRSIGASLRTLVRLPLSLPAAAARLCSHALVPAQDFPRVRVGIGRPVGSNDVAGYVLGSFTALELAALRDQAFPAALAAVRAWVVDELRIGSATGSGVPAPAPQTRRAAPGTATASGSSLLDCAAQLRAAVERGSATCAVS